MQKTTIAKSVLSATVGAILLAAPVAPGFAQQSPEGSFVGLPHSHQNSTDWNAQNGTNPDAKVPALAPGAAVGLNQPAATVQNPAANDTNDTILTDRVKAALQREVPKAGDVFHVKTINGVVYLSGHASRADARRATTIAHRTAGVREVINDIRG